jgi:hypothetical protein
MEATCDIRMIDEGDQLIIGAAFEVSISFTQINIDFDGMLDRWHRKGCVCLLYVTVATSASSTAMWHDSTSSPHSTTPQ